MSQVSLQKITGWLAVGAWILLALVWAAAVLF